MTRKRLRMARSINQAASIQEHVNASEPMTSKMKKLLIIIAFCSAIIPGASALDTAKIDNITGLKGKRNEKEGGLPNWFFSQRRGGGGRWIDDAAVHG